MFVNYCACLAWSVCVALFQTSIIITQANWKLFFPLHSLSHSSSFFFFCGKEKENFMTGWKQKFSESKTLLICSRRTIRKKKKKKQEHVTKASRRMMRSWWFSCTGSRVSMAATLNTPLTMRLPGSAGTKICNISACHSYLLSSLCLNCRAGACGQKWSDDEQLVAPCRATDAMVTDQPAPAPNARPLIIFLCIICNKIITSVRLISLLIKKKNSSHLIRKKVYSN